MASKPRSDDPRMKGRSIKRLISNLPQEPSAYFCTRCGCCEAHCPCREELEPLAVWQIESGQGLVEVPDLVEFAERPCPICELGIQAGVD
jgi:hypothetical protein